ncbi:MAG: STAS domain-containing protein [Candidatus Hydrogenedentes bacterium]|nr:STAS domain-containing protein [Candidatus Hydrogenedentota bacterium]MBI3119115.1 STAS domain-containing protein [Candidatus Hydrogenedentota bacterium]
MALTLETHGQDEAQVVRAKGEVDLYSSPQLREAILKAVEVARHEAHVDLSGVPYMDSSGVATLVEGLKAANQRQKKFVVLAPSPSVMKVLHLSRLDTVFEIRPAESGA